MAPTKPTAKPTSRTEPSVKAAKTVAKTAAKPVAKPGVKPARSPAAAAEAPFWRVERMSEMTAREWESLCDGCGRCCLNKLTDIDTNETVYTDVGCTLLDGQSCRCIDYAHRQAKVSDCVKLSWRNVSRLTWLPPTCGYRLVAEGRDLPWWHPLVSGDPDTVHAAGVSVRGKVGANEKDVPDDRLEDFIVSWPGKWPKGSRGSVAPAKVRELVKKGKRGG